MANICIIKSCISRRNNKNITFHRFPDAKSDLRQKWIEAISDDNKVKQLKPNSKLCHLHFKKTDYAGKRSGNLRLKKDAVPSKHLSLSTSKENSESENSRSGEMASKVTIQEEQINNSITATLSTTNCICRACLAEGDKGFQIILEKNLNSFFTDLTSIEISDLDEITKMICSKCTELLNKFNAFKKTCLQSNELLKQKIEKVEDIKEEDMDETPSQSAITFPINNILLLDQNFDDRNSIIKNETSITCDTENQEDLTNTEQAETNKKDEAARETESDEENEKIESEIKAASGAEKTKYKKTMEENGFVKCPHCDKQFSNLGTFYKHKRDHFTTSMCDLCGLVCSSSRALRTHHIFKHSEERKFKCLLCEFAFKVKSSLESHMQSRHTNDRNYVCDRCSATFKSKRSVQAHIRMIHSNKPLTFECDQCNKKFKTRAHLQVHKQSHTGEKLYFCPLCRTEFTTKKYRNIHMEKKRCQGKPFQCHVCLQIFKEKRNHRIHMRRFHPDEGEAKAVQINANARHLEHQPMAEDERIAQQDNDIKANNPSKLC